MHGFLSWIPQSFLILSGQRGQFTVSVKKATEKLKKKKLSWGDKWTEERYNGGLLR